MPRRPVDNVPYQRGIILLEILVAFAILSISLTIILQTAGASVRHQRTIENRITAASHAANVLARIGIDIPVDSLQLAGDIDEKFTWRALVQPAENKHTLASSRASLTLVSIVLEIEWSENLKTKTYELETKRIVKRESINNAP